MCLGDLTFSKVSAFWHHYHRIVCYQIISTICVVSGVLATARVMLVVTGYWSFWRNKINKQSYCSVNYDLELTKLMLLLWILKALLSFFVCLACRTLADWILNKFYGSNILDLKIISSLESERNLLEIRTAFTIVIIF